jgi:hypothetical protein
LEFSYNYATIYFIRTHAHGDQRDQWGGGVRVLDFGQLFLVEHPVYGWAIVNRNASSWIYKCICKRIITFINFVWL